MGQPIDNRRRGAAYRFSCPCGMRILAARVTVRGRGVAAFFALTDHSGVARGRRVRRCPQCRRDLPGVAWEDFQEHAWPGGMAW